MRKTFGSLVCLLFPVVTGIVLFCSCASTDDGGYVNPITQYEKIGGHWIVNTVTQTDETNKTSLDLTNVIHFDSFGIDLNVDSDNKPTTFQVNGTAPALIPTSGNWQLLSPYVNSDGSPTVIMLNGNTRLTVTAVPGASPNLEFKFTRYSQGVAFVSYTYNLISQVE